MTFPAFLGIASTLVQAILAVVVLVKSLHRRENRLFSLLLFLFMLWSVAELNLIYGGLSEVGVKLLFTPGILLSYFFCVFTAIYPEHQPDASIIKTRHSPLLFFLPAAILLYLLWSGRIIASLDEIAGGFTLSFGRYEFVLKGIIIGYLFLTLSTLSKSRKNAETQAQIRRLRYTFTAMLLPVAAGSITIALSKWFIGGMTVYSFGLFPVLSIIMSVILSYTMLKYNLMEIDLIFSIGLVYTLLTAILAGSMELMQELMQAILNFSGVWSRIISILLIAAVFSPLKEMLISLVDRFFGRQNFDSAKVMQNILSELRKQPDQAKLFSRFTSELQLILDFAHARVAVPSAPEVVVFQGIDEDLNEVDAIAHHFAGVPDPAQEKLARDLRARDTRHYFAFRNENDFYGCLLLGPKNSKVPYTETELNLVQGLTKEIPHILENLQMIDRLLTQEKISQEIQWAGNMLQAISAANGTSSFAGLRIATFATLSGEIKGDMIDVCDLPENRFIGLYDAFHHGLQAVLTLNILFSVFRSIQHIPDKLRKAGEILQHFTQQQLCSAVTIISVNGNKVSIQNCGNPHPLLISDGKVTPMPLADSRPVGLTGQTEPAICDIIPGENDLLFFSTNGLFKAFKEMKGIELTEFLAGSGSDGVEACRQRIIAEISPFIRKRYSDDITFIVAGLK